MKNLNIKKSKKMKKVFYLFISVLIISCSNDQDIIELTKAEEIKSIILEKVPNANFEISEGNVDDILLAKPLYFDNIEQLTEFLKERKKINIQSRDVIRYHSLLDDIGGNGGSPDGYTKVIDKRSLGFCSINIQFYVRDCEANQLTSYITGATLGVSYNHLGGIAETVTYNTSGGTSASYIDYMVDGQINYNLFVEGIGTFFSEYVSYSGRYRCD